MQSLIIIICCGIEYTLYGGGGGGSSSDGTKCMRIFNEALKTINMPPSYLLQQKLIELKIPRRNGNEFEICLKQLAIIIVALAKEKSLQYSY